MPASPPLSAPLPSAIWSRARWVRRAWTRYYNLRTLRHIVISSYHHTVMSPRITPRASYFLLRSCFVPAANMPPLARRPR